MYPCLNRFSNISGFRVPGNGLNHNFTPNTVYRPAVNGGTDVGIDLVAISNIKAGDELYDDKYGEPKQYYL